MIERWRPVPDYEDLYQVSDQGRVRRIAGGMGTYAGLILRPRDNGRGYLRVVLFRETNRKEWLVHILVTGAFLGRCPKGLEVNHKNGVKDANRVGNLEYVTHAQNLEHRYRVLGQKSGGWGPRGEANGQAKLTEASVREIRRLYAEGGVIQDELAERYGVAQVTVWRILHRETWVHVTNAA